MNTRYDMLCRERDAAAYKALCAGSLMERADALLMVERFESEIELMLETAEPLSVRVWGNLEVINGGLEDEPA